MSKVNDFYFQQTNNVVFESSEPVSVGAISDENKSLVSTMLKNLHAYNVTLSENAILTMLHSNKEEIVKTYNYITSQLVANKGGDLKHAKVFYSGFPNEVMNKSDMEALFDKLIYYMHFELLGIEVMPEHKREDLTTLPFSESFERPETVIDFVSKVDVYKYAQNLLYANNVISGSKIDFIKEILDENNAFAKDCVVPGKKIPTKENAVNFAMICNEKGITSVKLLNELLPDTIDVLRYAAILSGNDAQLNGKVIFKLSSKQKRLIKSLLEQKPHLFEDTWKQKGLFKALGRTIGTRDKNYPRLTKAFDCLCSNQKLSEDNKPIYTPNALSLQTEESIKNGNLDKAEQIAKNFPGIYARNFLRYLDATSTNEQKIELAKIYNTHCTSVPIRETLKLLNYINANQNNSTHIVGVAKTNTYLELPVKESRKYDKQVVSVISNLLFKTALESTRTMPSLGNVYINKELRNYKLPENGERQSSKGATLTYGSSWNNIPDCNIIRAFTWWTNEKDNVPVDLDISSSFYDADFNIVTVCSYATERLHDENRNLMAITSGDIRDGGNIDGPGAAEFIDVDINQLKANNIKYVTFSLNSYSREKFKELPNVKFGIMQRQGGLCTEPENTGERSYDVFNGEKIELSTVEHLIDLNTNATNATLAVFDVENARFVWIDKPSRQSSRTAYHPNQIASQIGQIKHALTSPTPTMEQLFYAHALGRGELVSAIEDADTVFIAKKTKELEPFLKDKTVITANDIDEISANYLSSAPQVELDNGKPATKKSRKRDSVELEL